MNARVTSVLIVDDSATARAALRIALSDHPEVRIVGEAADGGSAVRLLEELRPDLVTMDVFLRRESGFDVARAIMATRPTPIVAITAANHHDKTLLFSALQVGVLDVCAKLPAPKHPDYERKRAALARTLRVLADVPLVSRPGPRVERRLAVPMRQPAASPPPEPAPAHARLRGGASGQASAAAKAAPRLLLIGASTGGPPRLAALLRALPKPFPLPIVIVQHIATGFVDGLASWLLETTGHPTCVVRARCELANGCVYLAADDHHLVLDAYGRIEALATAPRNYHRPSVDVLFESAAALPAAARSIAILMTGMGQDGASGLLSLRRAGALTIAQTPASCAVAAMPSAAIELDAAAQVLDPEGMPAAIIAEVFHAVYSR
jgi:two-component system chemotaxis response regulator CheB